MINDMIARLKRDGGHYVAEYKGATFQIYLNGSSVPYIKTIYGEVIANPIRPSDHQSLTRHKWRYDSKKVNA